MRVVATEEQNVVISPFDVIPLQTQRLTQFDQYKKTNYLIDSIFNFDGEDLTPFAPIEEDFLVDSFNMLGVPESLVAEVYDEDEAIAKNAIEETRLYLADSYLDELETDDLVDYLGDSHTHNKLKEIGEDLIDDEDYMADWYAIFSKGDPKLKRYGDDGKLLKGHKRMITIGHNKKTGEPIKKEAWVYDRGGEPSHAEKGHKRGASSPTRHHKKTLKLLHN